MSHRKTILSTLMLLAAISGKAQADTYNNLCVNEIMTANIDQEIDPSYNYGGWIEIYNSGNANVSLGNIYISDDANTPTKFRLDGTVSAKGYKRIWFDHNSADGVYGNNASKQVRFKMDADGGTLYFSDSTGKLLFSQDYPAAITRCSYCRTTDGGNTWQWTGTPTPGQTNDNSVFADKRLAAPVVDTDSRLFTTAFDVHVDIPEGAQLYYTSDGTTPDKTKTISTDGTFTVNRTRVYRFRLYQDGYLPSPVVTRSYISKNKEYYLPIVSVVTDRKNLYDNTIGVYTVGTNGVDGRGTGRSNKNMDWERPVSFDYIVDGEGVLSQEATFSVCGGWSRHHSVSSFKLKGEKQYEGQNFLPYEFFEQKPYIKNKVIMMRNGGNDFDNRSKDAVIQHVIQTSGFYVDGQSYNPCHVFINGTYLAMLNMREPSNKHFAYANYGIDTDLVDAYEISPDSNPNQTLMAGSTTAFNEWLSKSNNAATPSVYEDIINNYVDIDEFINYFAAETWLGCWDWLTNNNNTKWFRSQLDGKFHFVMFDLDSAFDTNSMLSNMKNSTRNNPFILFNRMSKNADFKKQFATAYCIFDGSVFTPERAQQSATYVGQLTEKALGFDNRSPWGSCNEVANKAKDNNARTTKMNALKNFFTLGSSVKASINANISEAVVEINGMEVPTGKFNGTLFPPFTLTASAPAGYNFVGWQQGNRTSTTLLSTNSTWKYYDKGSLDGKDWKTGDVSSWSSGTAPLGYGRSGTKTTLSYGSNSNNKIPTYYFRNTINLTDEPKSTDLFVLDYGADDGFVIYVNGKEAGRYNMNAGTPKYSDYATTYAEGNPDYGTLTLDGSGFRKGENIIAVEVHNNSGSSTDIWWQGAISISRDNGEIVNPERTIEVNTTTGNVNYTAIFEPLPEELLIEAGQTPVMVNEISAGNEVFINDYYKKNDWIELYNTTSEDIDVAGMYLSDSPSKPTKFQIPTGNPDVQTIIPAHGYLVIWADKLDPLWQLHTTFKLGNNDGECVVLTAADQSWSNTLEYNAHKGDESVGRYPDGGKRVYKMTRPTIGGRNHLTSYSKLLSGEDVNFGTEDSIDDVNVGVNGSTMGNGVKYYNVNGAEISTPQRGINIVRNANGTTKKVVIK